MKAAKGVGLGKGSARLVAEHLRAHARLRLGILQHHQLALRVALTILLSLLLLGGGLDGHLLLSLGLAEMLVGVIPLVQLELLFPWLLIILALLAAARFSVRSLAVALALTLRGVLALRVLVVFGGRLEVRVHVRVVRVLRDVDE